jgi:hypothetical protein
MFEVKARNLSLEVKLMKNCVVNLLKWEGYRRKSFIKQGQKTTVDTLSNIKPKHKINRWLGAMLQNLASW